MRPPAQRQLVTLPALTKRFRGFGIKAGMTLLVHSSLSSLGWVCGGPATVILALQAVLGRSGTLVMPTHSSDLTEPSRWCNPPIPSEWWDEVRATMPPYQPDLTVTRGMGAIPECFRKQNGVIRSNHPQLSFAAWGHHADSITANHQLEFGLGEQSPLARLYDLNATILLLGVGHASNTSLHLAETRAKWPSKAELTMGSPVLVEGHRQWVEYQDLAFQEDDFPQIGAAFEQAHPVTLGRVFEAPCKLFPQVTLVDFAESWMNQHRS